MPSFIGGSAPAMANQVAEGYFLLNKNTLARLHPRRPRHAQGRSSRSCSASCAAWSRRRTTPSPSRPRNRKIGRLSAALQIVGPPDDEPPLDRAVAAAALRALSSSLAYVVAITAFGDLARAARPLGARLLPGRPQRALVGHRLLHRGHRDQHPHLHRRAGHGLPRQLDLPAARARLRPRPDADRRSCSCPPTSGASSTRPTSCCSSASAAARCARPSAGDLPALPDPRRRHPAARRRPRAGRRRGRPGVVRASSCSARP